MSAQLNPNTHQTYGFAYDQIVVGWGVPQNPEQTKQPLPIGFPCPPTMAEILQRGGRAVAAVLEAAYTQDNNNAAEAGGWFYMNKKGDVMAKLKPFEPGRDNRTTVFNNNPPVIKGWRVVGTFHTHDWGGNPSTADHFVRDGITYATFPNDIDNAEARRVPGLILGGSLGERSWSIYGPTRGYWKTNFICAKKR